MEKSWQIKEGYLFFWCVLDLLLLFKKGVGGVPFGNPVTA